MKCLIRVKEGQDPPASVSRLGNTAVATIVLTAVEYLQATTIFIQIVAKCNTKRKTSENEVYRKTINRMIDCIAFDVL